MTRYVVLITVLFLVTGSAMAQTWQDPNCADVAWYILPCTNFLQGVAPIPSWGCCSQLNVLNTIAKAKGGQGRICQCIQDLAAETGDIVSFRADDLSGMCNLPLGFPISNDIDCSSVD